jgi:hypothetical protein
MMNMQHSGNRAGTIPVTAHPVILSAIPVTAHPVILSAIPVYRDVVEERGGMAMPPMSDTRHITTLGRLHLPTYFDFTPLRSVALNMTAGWFRL